MLRDRIRDENGNLLRGLSRKQICIGVATDKKHTICFFEGFGKPSQKRSYETFKDHIASGSTLVHDKEKAHILSGAECAAVNIAGCSPRLGFVQKHTIFL